MNLIELRDVRRTYTPGAGLLRRGQIVRAVDGVTLAIPPSARLAVIGASGSGKSTLGRLILGLEKPDAGEVLYRGQNRHVLRGDDKQRARRAVQAVFQNAYDAVNPDFTAFDIIGEPLKNFDGMPDAPRRARVEELLEMVGLAGRDMKKQPLQFSGGELQRVCLARALAPRPELIVLDEATSGLDTPSQTRILRLLDDIGRETGCAYVMISHDLRAVRKFAGSVAVMDNGRLAAYAADMKNPADAAGLHNSPAFRELADAALPPEPPVY